MLQNDVSFIHIYVLHKQTPAGYVQYIGQLYRPIQALTAAVILLYNFVITIIIIISRSCSSNSSIIITTFI